MIDKMLHSVEEAERRADWIRKDAGRQAERMLEEAREEAAILKRKNEETIAREREQRRACAEAEIRAGDEESAAGIQEAAKELRRLAANREEEVLARLTEEILRERS